MGRGNDRPRKTSATSFFCFGLFRSQKHRYYYEEAYADGIKAQKVWPSDEDRGSWGVAEPGIDTKVQAFLDAQAKKRISQTQ